ncbi:MAG: hypothetical protein COA82_02240 [Alkaliphilus sp.]|nr:MAG: hypothetical protein COA82_02240 [Alkaliphilus sp.]
MGRILLLFRAILIKEVTTFKRYFFNSMGGLITTYLFFMLIFWGYSSFAGGMDNFGATLEGMVVGYILWLNAIMVYENISYSTIINEAKEGTLEQLYMSSFSFGWVVSAIAMSRFIINVFLTSIMLFVIILSTGVSLNIDLVSILPLLILTVLNFLGIGFMLGGVALIFKKMHNYLQIVQFLFLFAIAAPVATIPWTRFLPGSWGSHLIREVMVNDVRIMDFSVYQILFLITIGLVYLALGYGAYKICEKHAMQRGLIGHY